MYLKEKVLLNDLKGLFYRKETYFKLAGKNSVDK